MTATDTDLNALLERVRSATGADREIDREVWVALSNKREFAYASPKLTTSNDSALAFARHHLGDNWFGVTLDALREFGASGTLGPEHLPRFIIAATLQALISRALP